MAKILNQASSTDLKKAKANPKTIEGFLKEKKKQIKEINCN